MMPAFDLPIPTLPMLLMRLVCAALVSAILGWTMAWATWKLGDTGPKFDGRLTPNPLPHIDLTALMHAAFFRVLWIRPLDIDRNALAAGWRSRVAIVLGPSILLMVTSAVALAARSRALGLFDGSTALAVDLFLTTYADIAVISATINLIPLPPYIGTLLLPLSQTLSRALARPRLYWLSVALVTVVSLIGVTSRIATMLAQGWRSLLGY